MSDQGFFTLPAHRAEQRELIYLAIPRMLAVPLFFGFLGLKGDEFSTGVWIVAACATIYVLTVFWISVTNRWSKVNPLIYIPGDMVIIGSAMLVTGGPDSEVPAIFFVWTIAMSLIFPPRTVLICALAAVFTCAVTSIPAVLDDSEDLRQLGVIELVLAWIGLVTYLVADSFERRESRIGRLSEARRSLLADALSAEDRARRRLSQNLHDEALQTLLAAGQDLDAGIEGDPTMLRRAREELRGAVRGLRETIRGLHPAALEHGGLAGGLDAVTEQAAGRGGFVVDLRVDPEAGGSHDALIISLVRELTANVVKHAEADTVTVEVTRAAHSIEVEVSDDGRGIRADARSSALAAGHIGLASALERVEAVAGTMVISSAPDRGTRIDVSLPLVEAQAPIPTA